MGRGSDCIPIHETESPLETKQPKFFSTQRAAEYVGLSIPTFRKYREMGRIPFRKAGDFLYKYDKADLDDFIAKRRRGV